MRALVVRPGPAFSVQDVARGWVKGLRACGVDVVDLNLDDRLDFYSQTMLSRDGEVVKALSQDEAIRLATKGVEIACYEWWPDLVLIISGFFVPLEMYAVMRDRGHHVAVALTESPYEDDRQLHIADQVDTILLNDPTNIDKFTAINERTFYAPHAYDPDVHHPGAGVPEFECDFAFVGTGYPSRIEFLEQVDWPTDDVIIAGNWQALDEASPLRRFVRLHELDECLPNETAAQVYRSAKMSANLYRREAQRPDLAAGWSVGPREVELAACGAFFLREPRGEGDDLFPELPAFSSPEEFSELLATWLPDDSARTDAAARARTAVEGRTFEANAAWFLDKVAAPARV